MRLLILILIITLHSLFPGRSEFAGEASLPALAWLKKTGAKEFPKEQKSYKVADFGAVGDGVTLNTSAIQAAIDACAKQGGGIVTFSKGTYLTGSIFIKSNVNLKIEAGVILKGSQNIKDYREIQTRIAGFEMKWPAALVNVLDQHNAAITGSGIIDGQGNPFWEKYWKERKEYERKGLRWAVDYDVKRPRSVLIQNARDITLSDVTIKRAGFWSVHILYSEQVTVRGIRIRNNEGGRGPSTDGIDVDSSVYVRIEDCDIDCNDDNYCLKAGRDADGLRVNRPTEYIWIRNCVARAGGGLLTIGSETSGSIRHVLIEKSKAIGTGNGINFKSALTRGGTVSDIYVRDLDLKNVRTAFNISMNWNPSYSYSKLPEGYDYDEIPNRWKTLLEEVPEEKGIPRMEDISISNIKGQDCKVAITARGMEASYLKNFRLSDINLTVEKAGTIDYADTWTFKKVHIKSAGGELHLMDHTRNMTGL